MYAEVIPLRRLPPAATVLHYIVPTRLKADLAVGQLVRIPFRTTVLFGLVKALYPADEVVRSRPLKTLSEVAVQPPLVGEAQLNFLTTLSTAYGVSLGWLVKQTLPLFGPRALKQWRQQPLQRHPGQVHLPLAPARHKPNLCLYRESRELIVYLKKYLREPGQKLIIVPELFMTLDLWQALSPSFRQKTTLITGELTPKKFFDEWKKIWTGEKSIIIGTRRAFFLSFWDLRHIFIIDEGNSAHKNWDQAPRLHGRDAGYLLAAAHGARLHLTAHTPSVASYYQFQKTESALLARIPPLYPEIIDLTHERRAGLRGLLSDRLTAAIQAGAKGVTFLYLNRRGNLNYVSCSDCGVVSRCPRCQTTLVYYAKWVRLSCRHCDYTEPFGAECPKCQGLARIMYGSGVAQVEKELRALLPSSRRVVRLERAEPIKANFAAAGTVIIGTRFAYGKVPWKKISRCAFLEPDSSLFIPEYGALEELWQLIRTAAFHIPTPLLIQTNYAGHWLFQALRDPKQFYIRELNQRKIFSYPPFCFLVRLFQGFPTPAAGRAAGLALRERLSPLTKGVVPITIEGPFSAFPEYAEKKHWQVLLLKLPSPESWKLLIQIAAAAGEGWKLDPNPGTVLSL